jgi:hypothetical protein
MNSLGDIMKREDLDKDYVRRRALTMFWYGMVNTGVILAVYGYLVWDMGVANAPQFVFAMMVGAMVTILFQDTIGYLLTYLEEEEDDHD